jgi:hypothetical protein
MASTIGKNAPYVQEVVGPANIATAAMALAGSSFAESLGTPIDGVYQRDGDRLGCKVTMCRKNFVSTDFLNCASQQLSQSPCL